MKTIKSLLLVFLTIITFTSSIDAATNYKSFAYLEWDRVNFSWSRYQFNDFNYYSIIRINPETNNSQLLQTIRNRAITKFIDNDPVLWKWSIYKACVTTFDWVELCSIPYKIYVSYNTVNTTFYNRGRNIIKFDNNYRNQTNSFYSDNLENRNYSPEKSNRSSLCSNVKQPAVNPRSWTCRVYSSPCDVPIGWKNVSTCNSWIENIWTNYLTNTTKKRMRSILLKFVDKIIDENISNKKKLDMISRSIVKLDSVAKKWNSRLSYIADYSAGILRIEYDRYKRDFSLDTGIYNELYDFLKTNY